MKPVVLMDGGMGQELVRRSGREPTPSWSAAVLAEQPDLVRDVHVDFIRAGAKVIIVNSYAATPERLAARGMADAFDRLQSLACEVASQAREEAGVPGVQIAACLPPLVASYRPELAPDYDTSLSTYRRVAQAQADHCDLMLCETLASPEEIRAAATAASETGKPVWVGMTIRDDGSGLLRSGATLQEAHDVLDDVGVEARLLNCSKPESIRAAWSDFRKGNGPLGAYANGFTSVEALVPTGTVAVLERRTDLDAIAYADFIMDLIGEDAVIVGGCCEVGPGHIAEIARRLTAAGRTISGSVHG